MNRRGNRDRFWVVSVAGARLADRSHAVARMSSGDLRSDPAAASLVAEQRELVVVDEGTGLGSELAAVLGVSDADSIELGAIEMRSGNVVAVTEGSPVTLRLLPAPVPGRDRSAPLVTVELGHIPEGQTDRNLSIGVCRGSMRIGWMAC